MLAGSERIFNWYLDFDLHPDEPPRVVTFCPVQPGNHFALLDRLNWATGENLTLLFCPQQVRVFRQAQMIGTFPWPLNGRFDVDVAIFVIALCHRNVRPVSKIGQRTVVVPLSTIVPDVSGRAYTISTMLRARTRRVPGCVWIGKA